MTTFLRGMISTAFLGVALFCLWRSGHPGEIKWPDGSPAAGRSETPTVASASESASTVFNPADLKTAEVAASEALARPTLSPAALPHPPGDLIVIDAGHGGDDGGAVVGEILEKKWALRIALELAEELSSRGHRILLTRKTDVTLALADRSRIANEMRAALFVSVHLNTSSDISASGVEVFHSWPKDLATMAALKTQLGEEPGFKDDRGERLAQSLQSAIVKSTGARDRGIQNRTRLSVTRRTIAPAVLAECGFLTNEAERKKILDDQERKKIVLGLVTGIEDYLAAAVED